MAEAPRKKQHLEYIGIGLLVLVALVLGLSRFKKSSVDDEVFTRTEFNKKWAEVEIIEAKVPADEKPIDYAVSNEREPFKGPLDEEQPEESQEVVILPQMTYQGMIWKSRRPQAVINNKVYDIGDTIEMGTGETREEIKVKDVATDGIHLKYKGREFIVRPK